MHPKIHTTYPPSDAHLTHVPCMVAILAFGDNASVNVDNPPPPSSSVHSNSPTATYLNTLPYNPQKTRENMDCSWRESTGGSPLSSTRWVAVQSLEENNQQEALPVEEVGIMRPRPFKWAQQTSWKMLMPLFIEDMSGMFINTQILKRPWTDA